MKKNSSSDKRRKAAQASREFGEQKLFALAMTGSSEAGRITIGLDTGDRSCCWCALACDGEVMARGEVVTERQPLEHFFSRIPPGLVALEVGSHSAWIRRLLIRKRRAWSRSRRFWPA